VSLAVDPAREYKVVERAASTFKPREDAGASGLKKLELNGAASLPLDDDCSGPNPTTADEVADPNLDDVTAAQLAVDREVKHGAVSDPSLAVKPEADGPDLLRFERALRAELPTCVPHSLVSDARIVLGISHSPSPRRLMRPRWRRTAHGSFRGAAGGLREDRFGRAMRHSR
jgi:hypothetical protein